MIRLYRSLCLRLSVLVLSAGALAACVTNTQWNPSDYTVRSGDTLYSIAWRYELDPDDLARWNHLGEDSVIHPGDRLHTRPLDNSPGYSHAENTSVVSTDTSAAEPVPSAAVSGVIVVRPGDTLYSLARQNHLDLAQLIRANKLKPPYRLLPGQKLYTRSQSQGQASVAPAPPVSIAAPGSTYQYPSVVHWTWPLKGKIVSSFKRNSEIRKGIDIAGHAGEDVRAAAAGKVVYSGNGLISFGNLVIIKHNDAFLSAYAHNRSILVVEGQRVKQGQVIATIGKTENSDSVLHFEIRKHGKPVNPLHYLPHG